jgi:PTH1 family peptidyl-tRNA hydrolase
MTERFLIAGLGNPGRKYAKTWHNLGFMAVEILSQRHLIPVKKIRFKGLYGEGIIQGKKVVLLTPSTYMNASGESVRAASDYFRIKPENLLVISDDIDLLLGTIRLRGSGSAGTHNGLKSVILHLGTDAFPRLRIGMGPRPEGELADIVLGEIPQALREEAFAALTTAADAVERFLTSGLEAAQQVYNLR